MKIANKKIIFTIILLISLILIIGLFLYAEEKVEVSNANTNEKNTLDGWLGHYEYHRAPEKINGEFDGYTDIEFIIFQEAGKYFGYLNIDGEDDKNSNFYDRVLVNILGTQDMIQVFFEESLSSTEDRGDMFKTYQKGELLFSFKREEEQVITVWENFKPEVQKNDLEKGFIRRYEPSSLLLINATDRVSLLRAFSITEETVPFYKYYIGDDALHLELYYDVEKCSGVGIYYGKNITNGFTIGKYKQEIWHDNKFSFMKENHDASSFKDYIEHKTYDNSGKLTYFYSEGIIEGYEDNDFIDKLVEIKFTYREDGTLERKDCWYNPLLFETIRSDEINFYDDDERLAYVDSYITHGFLEDYYIYDGSNREPSYCLTVDHMGWFSWEAGFTKFE